MVRIHIIIDNKVDNKFRNRFVRKKGDYSKKIQELMEKSLSQKGKNIDERRLK